MIPGDSKKWSGMYKGDYQGNLWQTFNIDIEKYPGRLALGDKALRFSSGLGTVAKFVKTNATATDQWFGIITDTDIIRNGNSIAFSGTWITDDTTGTFNDPKDMVVHEYANGEQRLLCSRATNIAILNSSGSANVWDDDWWTAVRSGPSLTTGIPHPMARLQRLVAVGDKQSDVPVLHTLDQNDVVQASRVKFPSGYTVRCIYTSSNRFWIGLQNDIGGPAKVCEWDGFSLTFNKEYDLMGAIPMTGFIVRDIPYFITETGQIFRFNGTGFEEVQRFALEDRLVLGSSDITTYGTWVEGDIVYINLNAPTVQSFTSTVLYRGSRRLRAGVWTFNTRNLNLYHSMGLGEYASAGTDVNYGASPFASVGAVFREPSTRYLIASATVYTGGTNWNTSTTSGIYLSVPNWSQVSNEGRSRGYFITPFIPIAEVNNMWQGLWVKFKKFVNANNKIVVKWRVADPLYNASAQDQGGNIFENAINAPGTWTSTTTFTCKVPVGVSAGDEVEILTGDNAGCSFAISTLSGTPDNSTLLTVTIAEAAPTSSTDTFLCRFENWKTETAITTTTEGFKQVPFTAPAHGEFIQLKVELRGFDVQIDELAPYGVTKTSKQQG